MEESHACCFPCTRSYCFVCDCRATECENWGDGSSAGDHCNAGGHDRLYVTLRRQALEQENAAAAAAAAPLAGGRGGAPVPAPAPARQQCHEVMRMWPQLYGLLAHTCDVSHSLQTGCRPGQQFCQLNEAFCHAMQTEMPDPSTDPELMKLATVVLPCEVGGGPDALAFLPCTSWQLAERYFLPCTSWLLGERCLQRISQRAGSRHALHGSWASAACSA